MHWRRLGDEPFEYALLRVVPRVEREEFVNVGVVLFSQSAGFLGAACHVDEDRLRAIMSGLNDLDRPVVLPLHPRTCKRLSSLGLKTGDNIIPLDPVGYLDMIRLQSESAAVLSTR